MLFALQRKPSSSDAEEGLRVFWEKRSSNSLTTLLITTYYYKYEYQRSDTKP